MPSDSSAPVADNETLTRKAAVSTSWSAISSAARQALALAGVSILGRLLGPDAYGLIGMSALITNFLLNFKDLGTGSAIIQRQQISQRMLSSLFWMNCGIGVLLSVIVFGVSFPAAQFFHEPRVTPIMQVLSVSFLITAVGVVHNSILQREMRFHHLGLADFTASFAGYAVAIGCALSGFGVWSLVCGNLVNMTTASAMYFALSRWRPVFVMDPSELKSIAGFSLNLSGFGLVNYFARNADNLVVGRVLGSGPLGYYQMAYNLMLFPIQNISSVIAQALFPGFARIQNDDARFSSAYTRSCMLIGFITFPVIAGLAVVARPLVEVILGSKWVPVIHLFQILAPVGIVQSVQTTVAQIYISKGRTDWMFRWGAIASMLLVTSFVIGVRWGVEGVAIAYTVTYFSLILYLGFAIPFRLIKLPFTRFAMALAPQIAITVTMTAASIAVLFALRSVAPAIQLAATVTTGALVYVVLMRGFKPPVVHAIAAVLDQLGKRPLSLAFNRVMALPIK
jgi:O-antigen/teichoic acid export membrane protein